MDRFPPTTRPLTACAVMSSRWGHRNPLGLVVDRTAGSRVRAWTELRRRGQSDRGRTQLRLAERGGLPRRQSVLRQFSNRARRRCLSSGASPATADPRLVPQPNETAWNDPRFMPPLRTFFTVENDYNLNGTGSATIAPGGIDYYAGTAIPGWNNSLLVLSLIRGAVYRRRSLRRCRSRSAESQAAKRYRDIALNPDGRTLYSRPIHRDPAGTCPRARTRWRTREVPGIQILERRDRRLTSVGSLRTVPRRSSRSRCARWSR